MTQDDPNKKPKKKKKPRGSVGRNPEDQKFRDFFTSRGWNVNRTYGRAINRGSPHPSGLGLDADPTGKSDEEVGQLVEEAIKFGYRAYDERWPQPGTKSTGPNIHFERAPSGRKPSAFHPNRYGSRTVEYLKQLDDTRRKGRSAPALKPEGESEFTKLLKQAQPAEESEFTKLLKSSSERPPEQQPQLGMALPEVPEGEPPELPENPTIDDIFASIRRAPESAPGRVQAPPLNPVETFLKEVVTPVGSEAVAKPVTEEPTIAGDEEFEVSQIPEGEDPTNWVADEIARRLEIRRGIPVEVTREYLRQQGVGPDPTETGKRGLLGAEAIRSRVAQGRKFRLLSDEIDELAKAGEKYKIVQEGEGDVLPSERHARLLTSGLLTDEEAAELQTQIQEQKNTEQQLLTKLEAEERDKMIGLLSAGPTYTEGGAKFKTLDDRTRTGKRGMDLLDEQAMADINKAAQERFKSVIKKYTTPENYFAAEERAQQRLRAIKEQRDQMADAGIPQYTVPLQVVSNIAQGVTEQVTDLVSSLPVAQEALGMPSFGDLIESVVTGKYKNSPATERWLYKGSQGIQKWVTENSYNDDVLNTSFILNDVPKVLTQMAVQVAAGAATGGALAPTVLGAGQGVMEQYKNAVETGADWNERRLRVALAAVAATPEFFVQRSILKAGGLLQQSRVFDDFLNNSSKTLFKEFATRYGEAEAKELTRSALAGIMSKFPRAAEWVKTGAKAVTPAAKGGVYEPIQETLEQKVNAAAAYYTSDRTQQRWNEVQFLTQNDLQTIKVSAVAGVGGGALATAIGRVGTKPNQITIDGKTYDTPPASRGALRAALGQYETALETWENSKKLFEAGRKQKTQEGRREYREAARNAYLQGAKEFQTAEEMYNAVQAQVAGETGEAAGRATPLEPMSVEQVRQREQEVQPAPEGAPTEEQVTAMTSAAEALAKGTPEERAAETATADQTLQSILQEAKVTPPPSLTGPAARTQTTAEPEGLTVGAKVMTPKGEGVITQDNGRTWQVDYNPKVNKAGKTVYQSSVNIRKDQVTPAGAPQLTAQPAEVKVAPYTPKEKVAPKVELKVAPYAEEPVSTDREGKTAVVPTAGEGIVQPLKRAFTSHQERATYQATKKYLQKKLDDAGFTLTAADLEAEHAGLFAGESDPAVYRRVVDNMVAQIKSGRLTNAVTKSLQKKLQRRPLTQTEQAEYHDLTQKVRGYLERRNKSLREGFDSAAVMKDLFYFMKGSATSAGPTVSDGAGDQVRVGDHVTFNYGDHRGVITEISGDRIKVRVTHEYGHQLDQDEQHVYSKYATDVKLFERGGPANADEAVTQYFEQRFPALLEDLPVKVAPFTELLQQHIIGPARQLTEISSALTFRPPYTVTAMLDPDFNKYRVLDENGNVRPISKETLLSMAGKKLKGIEKLAITTVLESPLFKDRKSFPLQEFEIELSRELLPLNVIFHNGHANVGAEAVSGMDPYRNPYDSYETHIYNVVGLKGVTDLFHTYVAHWSSAFNTFLDQSTYVVKEIVDIAGNITYVVIPESQQAVESEYPVHLRKLYEGEKSEHGVVKLTNKNLNELSVFNSSSRELAQGVADRMTAANQYNQGLFGHTRVWTKGPIAYVVEYQGEGLQKFIYQFIGQRAPEKGLKYDEGRQQWSAQKAVSTAPEMLWEHFTRLKNEGDTTHSEINQVIDQALAIRAEIVELRHAGEGRVAIEQGNSHRNEVAKVALDEYKAALDAFEKVKQSDTATNKEREEAKKAKKDAIAKYTAAVGVTALRVAGVEMAIRNLNERLERLSEEEVKRAEYAVSQEVKDIFHEVYNLVARDLEQMEVRWKEAVAEVKRHMYEGDEGGNEWDNEYDAIEYREVELLDMKVVRYKDPDTERTVYVLVPYDVELNSTVNDRSGMWSNTVARNATERIMRDRGIPEYTDQWYKLENAINNQFTPGPWTQHRDAMSREEELLKNVQTDLKVPPRNSTNLAATQQQLKDVEAAAAHPDFAKYNQLVDDEIALWEKFSTLLPLWAQQFVYHQRNFAQRMIREEIKRAAQRGQKVLRIPAAETGSLIEGHLNKGMIQASRVFDTELAGWEPISDLRNNRPSVGGTIRSDGVTYEVLTDDTDGFTAAPQNSLYRGGAEQVIQAFTAEDIPSTVQEKLDLAKKALEDADYVVLKPPSSSQYNFTAIPKSEYATIKTFEHAPPGEVDLKVARDHMKYDPGHQTIFDRFAAVAEWFQEERADAQLVNDEYGNRWYETKITDADLNLPVALFKAELIEQHADERHRFAEMEEFNDDFFKSVDSVVDDSGAIKLNFAAAELIRRIESQSKLDGGIDPFVPLFAAAFARQNEVKMYQGRVQDVLDQMTEAGYPEESKAGVQKLLSQFEQFENGAGVLYVRDWALPHEKIHEARYMNAALEASIQNYYKDFEKTFNAAKTDDGTQTVNEKAYNKYFGKEYFGGRPFHSLSQEEMAVLHEETFTFIVDGDYASLLGLTDTEAAEFIKQDLDAYIERNGPEILDDLEIWINEKTAKFGVISKLQSGFKATEELEKAGVSVQSAVRGGDGRAAERGEGAEGGPAEGEVQARVKGRAVPKTVAERTTLNEEDLTPVARQLETLPRDEAAKGAENWLQNQGFERAYPQVFDLPPSAESTAKRMAVIEHIDGQIELNYVGGNIGRAKEWYAKLVALTNAISPEYTEYGRAIGQLARWSDFDLSSVVGHVQQKMTKSGKDDALSLDQQQQLRDQAQTIADLENQIQKLVAKQTGARTPKEKVIDQQRIAAKSALARLKATLGTLSKANGSLKAAIDKIRKLGVQDTSAASWINRNEANVSDWSKILSSPTGSEDLEKRVDKQFKEAATWQKIKEVSTTNMKEYLDLQIQLVDQGVNLANEQIRRAVQAAKQDRAGAERAIRDYVYQERSTQLNAWKTYMTETNPTYAEDPYFRDFVWSDLTSLRDDRPDVPPSLDPAALAGVYTTFSTGNSFSSFSKLYKKEMARTLAEDTSVKRVKVRGGNWVKIPQTASTHPDFATNTGRLRSLSASTWCTSRGMETTYLQKGDFWIYQEDGVTQLAIRFSGSQVVEIQGRLNNGRIPVEYIDQVTELQNSGEVDFDKRAQQQIDRAKDQVIQTQKIDTWIKEENIDQKVDKPTLRRLRNAESLTQAQGTYQYVTNLQPWIEENRHLLSNREVGYITAVGVSQEYLERRFQDLNRRVSITRDFQRLTRRQQEDLLGLRKLPNGNYVFPHRVRIQQNGTIGNPIMQRDHDVPTFGMDLSKFLPKIEVFEKSVQLSKGVKAPKLRVAEKNLGIEGKGVEVPNLQVVGGNLFLQPSVTKEMRKEAEAGKASKFKNLVAVGGSVSADLYSEDFVPTTFPQLMRRGSTGFVKAGVQFTREPYWWTYFTDAEGKPVQKHFNTEEEAKEAIRKNPDKVYKTVGNMYMTPKKANRPVTLDLEGNVAETVHLGKAMNVKEFGANVRTGGLLKRAEDQIEGGEDFLDYTEEADDWPDLLLKTDDDRPLTNFDKDTKNALIDLGVYKFLEGRLGGGQSFDDWVAAVNNELTGANVDPAQLTGYYKSLYREVLNKVRADRNQAEIDRAKEKYGLTDDGEARQKLLEEKDAQVKKIRLMRDAEKAVKPERDKRTALQVAVDNHIEASGTQLTRDEVLSVRDRNKFFGDRAGKMPPAKISELYLEAVNLYIDATADIREAQEELRAVRSARGPGLSPALSKEEQVRINKELDEARKQKARQSHDLRKLIDHIVGRPVEKRERLGDWYKRINRSGEALLTATVKTATHNVIAQRATKLLNAIETAIELGFAKTEAALGVNLFAETGLDVPATTRFRDLIKQELKSSTFPSVQAAMKEMWDGEADLLAALQTTVAYKQRVVEGVLGHNPDLYDKMLGAFTYGEDMTKARPIDESYGMGSKTVERAVRGVEKYVHYGTVLNRVQEKHFRFATFLATVTADLKGHGVDLDQVIKQGETARVPRRLLERAVQRALEDTFGLDFPTDSTLGRMTKAASDTASWIPFIVNPLLFRRFFYNSNKFMIEHSPLVLAKTVSKAGFSRRDAAKFTTGLGMFVFALQLLKAFGSDDDDPTVLKVPTPYGPQNLRVNAFNPISTFLVAANFYNRVSKGKTPMKTGSEPTQLFGIDTRYPNLALDWWWSIINLTRSDADKYLKLGEQSTILGARGLAAFLRPLATVKDIIAQFDEMEGAVRDPMGQTFRTELGKTVPFISTRNVPGLQAPPLPREDVLTGKPLTKKSPLLDQLGLTFINDNQIGAKFSPAEEYLDQAAADERASRPKRFKDPVARRGSATTAQLFHAIDKGNNVKEAAMVYKKRGIISQDQLDDVLAANRIKSTIERKAKDVSLQKVVEAWWLANPEERKILERVIKIKRANQIYDDTYTKEEKQAVESIMPRQPVTSP